MSNIMEHVGEGKKATFDFYRDGILYYKTEPGLLFEVPISDTGKGTFNHTEKALVMMRWIRKQLEANAAGMKESAG